MRDPDTPPLDAAQRRLDTALDKLAAAVTRDRAPAPAPLFDRLPDAERARLEDELGQARTRERALEQVAAEASAALGRAAAEVRAALDAGA